MLTPKVFAFLHILRENDLYMRAPSLSLCYSNFKVHLREMNGWLVFLHKAGDAPNLHHSILESDIWPVSNTPGLSIDIAALCEGSLCESLSLQHSLVCSSQKNKTKQQQLTTLTNSHQSSDI